MAFVIGLIVSLIFLEWPERLFVIVPLAFLELAEVALWLRWRKRKSITGAEAIVGATGKAITDCRPVGQVMLKGQIWKARCRAGVEANEDVVVTGVDGIALEVAPLEHAESATGAG
jgi:membrane protein implicated in regulation of membrane protease activity